VPVRVTGKQQNDQPMYVLEEMQCIVLNEPCMKNLMLKKGTKVFVNKNLNSFDIV